MSLIRRLFASDGAPWRPPTNSVAMNISGSELSFDCPNASAWSSNPAIYKTLVDKAGAQQSQLDGKFRLSQPEYGEQAIFYREWSHWGIVFRPNYIAATSLCVWLIQVPKETNTDSLHCHDYLMKKFPLLGCEDRDACLNEGETVTISAGGVLGMPGDEQRPGYSRVCIMKDGGRELLDYSLLTLSCEHALVFEIYQAQAPGSNQFLMSKLTDQASKIIDSIALNLSQQELMTKEQVLRRYAEQTGGEYDEKLGCVLFELDLSDCEDEVVDKEAQDIFIPKE